MNADRWYWHDPGRPYIECPDWECDGSGIVRFDEGEPDLPCGSCEAGAAWLEAVIAVFDTDPEPGA